MASGALLVAALALVVDGGFALIQRYAVSPGLTGRFSTRAGRAVEPVDVELSAGQHRVD
jgi:osmoprotectant transport system permease protein